MRVVLGFLTGLLGLLAGWAGLATLVIALAGPDRDGGIAMGAVFGIGPIGGVLGFVVGVVLFVKLGLRRSPETPRAAPRRPSGVFATVVVLLCAGLGFAGWWEFVRSPYLTHGFMRLELRFRLPPGTPPPSDPAGVAIVVDEGDRPTVAVLADPWLATDGDRPEIRAAASLSYKTSRRIVHLGLADAPERRWSVDLSSDPDPIPEFGPGRPDDGRHQPEIELSYRLLAER